jgi:SAM-dependent methyltransferase/uncharacterized protein YbaR (Trm112 family)
MNISILSRLRCPACRESLQFQPFDDERSQRSSDTLSGTTPSTGVPVREGVLLCPACDTWYPVHSFVPVLLVFPTPMHAQFARQHEVELKALSRYHPPSGRPMPGESSVQETFTEEWNCVQESELSFYYSREELVALNQRVWLTWLRERPHHIRTVLNVGCGLGRESMALQEATGAEEIFAIDLNFGLLQSGPRFTDRPNIHLIIASLFHLPFESSSFDFVYSQGVLHHTYSTLEAFRTVLQYVRGGGYLFIWVYGREDHLARRGLARLAMRAHLLMEVVGRRLVSRSPRTVRNFFFAVLSRLVHPVHRRRLSSKSDWRLQNTNHDLRDWLSPRYAHRHGYNEVLEWFDNCGFRVIAVQSPGEYRRLFGRQLWGVGVSGYKETANGGRVGAMHHLPPSRNP